MNGVFNLTRRYPLVIFVISTFAISWSLWYLAGAYSHVTTDYRPLGLKWILAQVGVFAPAMMGSVIGLIASTRDSIKWKPEWLVYGLVLLIALTISGLNYEDLFTIRAVQIGVISIAALGLIAFAFSFSTTSYGIRQGGATGFLWLIASVMLVPAMMLAAMLLADREISWSPQFLAAGSILNMVLFALCLFSFNLILGGSLGEEPGWRGFALPLLMERYRPFTASMVLAIIWALWHAPLDLSHGFMQMGTGSVLARIIWTIPLSFLFTYFYSKSNGSVLVAILLHTSINFSFEFFQPSAGAIGLFTAGLAIFLAIAYAL